ncbi:hypothetical protein [Amycolatopsis sp. NPDC051903]|uniref:hypothetical protein n=1 Tax=Amycolatopsis sp. NPDC051903 TaxID=3363936 RepID=UPI0037B9B82A
MAALPASVFPAEYSAVAPAASGLGLYKLGYVTTDLDKAIETFTAQLGFDGFTRFSPSMDVTAEGQQGPAKLDCAFSTGRELVVELM